jgi:transketolase
MRSTFIRTLTQIASYDERVVLLTGDLGFSVIEPFADAFPDRFYNVGVAEQNMIGLATGLAESGFIPYTYSIATFATLRPFEFIRNGPVLQHLPVRIVGVGGGFEYGHAGPTHHAIEDIAVMRTQDGLAIASPTDYEQAASALLALHDYDGPVYFRLGKDERRVVPGLQGAFHIGKLEALQSGGQIALVATGSISPEVAVATEQLAAEGLEVSFLVAGCLSPVPVDDLLQHLRGSRVAIVVENHSRNGGLGSIVCEVVAENSLPVRVVRCGIDGHQPSDSGGEEQYLNDWHHLSASKICETVRQQFALLER